MIALFLLFISCVFSQECPNAIQISTPISSTYSYSGLHSLKDSGKNNKWSCQQIDAEEHEDLSMIFTFTTSETQKLEISTCHGQTDFASRMIIGSYCSDNVVSHCVGATDGDPNGLCEGHRSKLIHTFEQSVTYYVVVLGVTDNDLGTFQLTIKPYIDPSSIYCEDALEITSFPQTLSATVLSTQGYSGMKNTLRRGFWFKFTATQKTHVIDTCNKNTQYPTTIYLFDEIGPRHCFASEPILEANDGCGSMARLYSDKFEIGKEYYVFVFFTDDTSSSPVHGSLEISFRTNGGENYKCRNAFSIAKKPFNLLMDMSGIGKSTSSCHLNDEETGMYFSVRGDGRRYVFHTCYTQSTGLDRTKLELYKGDCNSCSQTAQSTCGNDALITAHLEKDVIYRFRVVCTNPKCKVNINLMQIDEKDNYLCPDARNITVEDLGDQFSQYLIGSNQESYTEFDCKDDMHNLKGGWYRYTAEKEDVTIMHGVYSFDNTKYRGYLADFDDCKTCVNSLHTDFISEDLFIPKGTSKYVFATTIRKEGNGNEYGAFMYWSIRSTHKGHSFEDAYEATAPFTGLFAIEATPRWECQCPHMMFPNLRDFPAVAVKFNQENDKSYIVSTCGSETVESTMIEIAQKSQSGNEYECYATAEYNDCGYGSTLTSSGNGTKYAIVGINPSSTATAGVLRFNLYANEQEKSSKCIHAEKLTIPERYYSYTSKGATSQSTCGILADGLRGKWFTYTPEYDISISIQTDDVSTFNTQIGVYTSCEEIAEVSVPGECYKGANYYSSPVGQHGTSLIVDLKGGQQYFIFVGGATNADSGLMRIKFKEHIPDAEEDDGLSGGEVFGIVVAVIALIGVIVVVGVFIGYIAYRKYNELHGGSQFNSF